MTGPPGIDVLMVAESRLLLIKRLHAMRQHDISGASRQVNVRSCSGLEVRLQCIS